MHLLWLQQSDFHTSFQPQIHIYQTFQHLHTSSHLRPFHQCLFCVSQLGGSPADPPGPAGVAPTVPPVTKGDLSQEHRDEPLTPAGRTLWERPGSKDGSHVPGELWVINPCCSLQLLHRETLGQRR